MSAAGKGGFPQGPQIGGGPAPIQQPSQPDIYQRYGGQQNVDSDPNTAGYQPPTASPMQPPQVTPQPSPGMGGGKSGPPSLGGIGGMGGKGGFSQGPGLNIPRPDIGPGVGIGGDPAPLDPNAPNALGPEGQQPSVPQQNASTGGKGGFSPQDAYQNYSNVLFGSGDSIYKPKFNPTDNNY